MEEVPLDEAAGRVSSENIYADRNFPPFDRVSMDGIAIDYSAFYKGRRRFFIEHLAPAGSPKSILSHADHAIEVMTGSVCPEGTNCVIRYEDLSIEDGYAHVLIEDVVVNQNVHLEGRDRKKGDLLLESGQILGPAQLGICAFVGKSKLAVQSLPRVLILSSGDELVFVEDTPEAHQIRISNTPTLRAQLKGYGIRADTRHLTDDADLIKAYLKKALTTYDAVLISGGVSKGKFDLIPEALHELGVEKIFHGVQQRPGKPFWFGSHADGCKVFAFPGNPVSAYVCSLVYFTKWLDASSSSQTSRTVRARLSDDVYFKPNLTYFLEVILRQDAEGMMWADPVKGQGSGDLANLVKIHGFIELEAGKDIYPKGSLHKVHLCS